MFQFDEDSDEIVRYYSGREVRRIVALTVVLTLVLMGVVGAWIATVLLQYW